MNLKFVLPMIFLGLVGCKSDNGAQFAGRWVEVKSSDVKPMTLNITAQGDSVIVDEVKTVFGKEFHDSYTGAVLSAREVSISAGPTSIRMVIEASSGQLHYKGRALEKAQKVH